MADDETQTDEPKPVKAPFEQSAADLAKAKTKAYDEDRKRLRKESKPKT